MGGYIPEAAVTLRRLIDHGPQDQPPFHPLPPPWDELYRAVAAAGNTPQARWSAFRRALHDHPNRIRLTLQVEDALNPPDLSHVGARHASPIPSQTPAPEKTFLPASHAFAPRAPRQSLVADLIARPSLNLLVGPSGAKKTYAALDLAVSLARAQPWLGRATHQANVLWIDEESGPNRFLDRLAQVMRAHQAEPDLPFHLASLAGFDLRDPQDLQILSAKTHQFNAALIVIDPLIGVIPGADENSVLHLAPIFRDLRALANRANAAILIIHHTNKAGLYRGSAHLRAAVDLMLTAHSAPHTPFVEFQTVKSRDIAPQHFAAQAHFKPPGPEPQRVWFTPANLAHARRGFLGDHLLSPAVQHILEYLEKHGPSSTKALVAEPKHCTPAQARRAIPTLLNLGLIERTNPGTHGTLAVYGLVK